MRSYIELSKEKLLSNYQHLRAHVPENTQIICVVKGNAYGHGLSEVVEILEGYAAHFGVDSVEELRKVRAISDAPVLVMGYVMEEALEEIVKLGAELVMYDVDRLKVLNAFAEKQGVKARVHIKIDAGLARQGVLPDALDSFLEELQALRHIEVVGAYAHFANLEDTENFFYAQTQIDLFERAYERFEVHGLKNVKRHISATAGALVYEKGQNDFTRVGLGLYGMWPAAHTRESCPNVVLKPVMRWLSHVAQVKTIPDGSSVGYGCTFVTQRETKVAIVPQGYADGYSRALSGKGEVLIGGTRCRVLGRVAMNMITVDVTHVEDVSREDEVVLLGMQGEEMISAEELAAKTDTINYEVTTRISALLPRVVGDDIATMNECSGSFDFLADEPDLYSSDDVRKL